MHRHGPWTIVKNHKIYQDPWVALQRDDVIRPDGLPGSYSTVEIKPGVTVVALDEQNIVHLTSEFHYAVGRVTLEGVSGGLKAASPLWSRPIANCWKSWELSLKSGLRWALWIRLRPPCVRQSSYFWRKG